MADIICEECKATVSDEAGSCPECGYPFGDLHFAVENEVSHAVDPPPQDAVITPSGVSTVSTVSTDIIVQTLDAVRQEMKVLQNNLEENDRKLNSCLVQSDESTVKMLTDISARIDAISVVQEAMKASLQPDDQKPTKKSLLAAFYKTLNSPNSMFEYMFYLCVVQTIFVIVVLFLSAYIVTLVR